MIQLMKCTDVFTKPISRYKIFFYYHNYYFNIILIANICSCSTYLAPDGGLQSPLIGATPPSSAQVLSLSRSSPHIFWYNDLYSHG